MKSQGWNINLSVKEKSIDNDHFKVVMKCRRRLFSVEDDKVLTSIVVNNNGITNWQDVAKLMPGKTARQCKDRWFNYLSPENKFSPWTKEEDETIINMVNSIGTKWVSIARALPGRSDNSIKNRWYSGLKKACVQDENGMFVFVNSSMGCRNDSISEKEQQSADIKIDYKNDVQSSDLSLPLMTNKDNTLDSLLNNGGSENVKNDLNNINCKFKQKPITVKKTDNIKRVVLKK